MTVVRDPALTMKRFELKYILDGDQKRLFQKALENHMRPDRFGLTTIASLYYDTPERRLITASLEKPPFKEKIRLRSYGSATFFSPVFLELKRKACGVVYKRRVQTTLPAAERFFRREADLGGGQIEREIAYFRDLYQNLVPAYLILYERIAYEEPGGGVRITLDSDPRCRTEKLDLTAPLDGEHLLPKEYAVLEIKAQSAVPLWLSRILSSLAIQKTSFSKVGEAYKAQLRKKQNGGREHV